MKIQNFVISNFDGRLLMYIQLNSQIICYEKTGEGKPIILLHGNGEDHHIFDELTDILQHQYTVYAMDLRGHGESATPKEYHYRDFAKDLLALIDALDIQKPVVLGYSDGAIATILAAITRPDAFEKIILCGANTSPKGLKHGAIHDIKKAYKQTKDERLRLMLDEPDINEMDLSMIRTPALVVAGENDCVKESDTKKICDGIGGARMLILPKEDHSSYINHSTKIYDYLRGEI